MNAKLPSSSMQSSSSIAEVRPSSSNHRRASVLALSARCISGMSWSALPIPRRGFPRKPLRQLTAEIRDHVNQRSQAALNKTIDLIVLSLVGRDSVHRLVDDII